MIWSTAICISGPANSWAWCASSISSCFSWYFSSLHWGSPGNLHLSKHQGCFWRDVVICIHSSLSFWFSVLHIFSAGCLIKHFWQMGKWDLSKYSIVVLNRIWDRNHTFVLKRIFSCSHMTLHWYIIYILSLLFSPDVCSCLTKELFLSTMWLLQPWWVLGWSCYGCQGFCFTPFAWHLLALVLKENMSKRFVIN